MRQVANTRFNIYGDWKSVLSGGLCFCLYSVEAGEAALFLGRARTCLRFVFFVDAIWLRRVLTGRFPSCVRVLCLSMVVFFLHCSPLAFVSGSGVWGARNQSFCFMCLERSVTRSSGCESYTRHGSGVVVQCHGKVFFLSESRHRSPL